MGRGCRGLGGGGRLFMVGEPRVEVWLGSRSAAAPTRARMTGPGGRRGEEDARTTKVERVGRLCCGVGLRCDGTHARTLGNSWTPQGTESQRTREEDNLLLQFLFTKEIKGKEFGVQTETSSSFHREFSSYNSELIMSHDCF
jgi:hypothetical protein